jgi:hypothetical protein
MTTHETSERFNVLYDQLGEVYETKEAHRLDVLAFHETITQFLPAIKAAFDGVAATQEENLVDKVMFKVQIEQIISIMEQLNALFERTSEYIADTLNRHGQVEQAMQKMMDLSPHLDAEDIPLTAVEQSVANMGHEIDQITISIDEAVGKLQVLTDELAIIKNKYDTWQQTKKLYDEPSAIIDLMAQDTLATGKEAADMDTLHFFLVVYRKWHAEVERAIKKIMFAQFPEFKAQKHPTMKENIDFINGNAADKIVHTMYNLIKEQASGTVPAEKYEKMERWREYYGKPRKAHVVTDKDRNKWLYPEGADAAWEQHKKEENEIMRIFHEWEEARLQQWYDVVQPLNFKYLPELNEIEGDYWILYAINMLDTYDEWKSFAERLELILDYGMDPSLFDDENEQFYEAMRNTPQEKQDASEDKRDIKIFGKILRERNPLPDDPLTASAQS